MTIQKRDSLACIKRSESEVTPGILVVGWWAASKTAPIILMAWYSWHCVIPSSGVWA